MEKTGAQQEESHYREWKIVYIESKRYKQEKWFGRLRIEMLLQ